jgi:hypothetical protein
MPAHGLMFHHFHDTLDHAPSQGSIDGDQLSQIIRDIGRGRILPALEFQNRAINGKLSEHHVCLTFDDNLLCQYDVAVPVLEDFGLTAFWFVYTSVMQGNIERLEIYRDFRNTQFPSIDEFYAAFFIRVYESEFGRRAEGALRSFEPSKYLAGFPFYSEADRRFRFIRDEVLGADAYAKVMDAMMADAHYDVRDIAKRLWMGDDEVLSLHESGHIVGLHSHTHPTRIERLSEDEWPWRSSEFSKRKRPLSSRTSRCMRRPTSARRPDPVSTRFDPAPNRSRPCTGGAFFRTAPDRGARHLRVRMQLRSRQPGRRCHREPGGHTSHRVVGHGHGAATRRRGARPEWCRHQRTAPLDIIELVGRNGFRCRPGNCPQSRQLNDSSRSGRRSHLERDHGHDCSVSRIVDRRE